MVNIAMISMVREGKRMGKVGVNWIGISSVMLLVLHGMANDVVVEEMLRKDLSYLQPETGRTASGVELIKMNFGPHSREISSDYLPFYQQQVFGLLINAMLADWELWLKSIEHKQDTLFYSHPWIIREDHTLQSKLLIAISRKFDHNFDPFKRPYAGIIPPQEKKRNGDSCKKALDDSKASVPYLLKGQLVRISDNLCILAFAVVRNDKSENNDFVNANMFDLAWKPQTFVKANLIDPEDKLLKMMKEDPVQGHENDGLVERKALGVTYHKVTLQSHYDITQNEILSLLDVARLKTWEYCREKCVSSTNIWEKHDICEMGGFSYYERENDHGMRMVIAIYRRFKREAPTKKTQLLQHKRVITSYIEQDKCQNIVRQDVLSNINVHDSHYLHMRSCNKECIISFGLVNCKDDNYFMVPPFENMSYEFTLWNMVYNVCPRNKLKGFFKL